MPYTKNLEQLKSYYGEMYTKILELDRKQEVEAIVEEARNKELIVKLNKDGKETYLNSRYNPSSEAEKYLDDLKAMPEESIITMFGFANGAFVREFVKINPDIECIVYEPSLDVFLKVLECIDISDIIKNPKVKLTVKGLNENYFDSYMGYMIKVYNIMTNKHIKLPKYGSLFEEECEYVTGVITDNYIKVQAVNNTIHKYGKKVCENNIHNMRFLRGCGTAVDYVGKFPEDMPAIVVAAGPSLEKNVHMLHKAKGKALIVAVDTAINKVLEAGVIPDMVIAIDFVKPLKYFTNPLLKDIPFLADQDLNYEVLEYVNPKRCIFFTADSLLWDRLFKEEGAEIRSMTTGGSVATSLISNFIFWNFKRIILVGQDLALTGNKEHAGEGVQDLDDSKATYEYVDAIGGGKVLTRRDFLTYCRWIESTAGICQDIDFIDASEGGALKKNTRVMSLEEAIDTYCVKEYDINQIINSAPTYFNENSNEKIKATLRDMITNLNKIKRQLINGASDCRRAGNMLKNKDINKSELKKINLSMEKLDEACLAMEERVLIEKYITDAETEFAEDLFVGKDDDMEEALRIYEKTEKYYRSNAEAIPEIIKIIEDCLEKMEKED
ncbi:MAG: motility associated factor glycosyltransferase family protein [Lachnospiraceae bacterium]|nr:motility associated factor glycosyltransferase family protein [Lachnospiraceae bacterium]